MTAGLDFLVYPGSTADPDFLVYPGLTAGPDFLVYLGLTADPDFLVCLDSTAGPAQMAVPVQTAVPVQKSLLMTAPAVTLVSHVVCSAVNAASVLETSDANTPDGVSIETLTAIASSFFTSFIFI